MAEVCIVPLPGGRVRIDLGGSSTEVDLPSLCTNDDYRLLRWYFEDYAEDDPFQTSKAQEARELVSTYGRRLARSVALPHLDTEHQPVHVKIIHGQGEDIFWESLEDPTLWPSSGQPSTVTVTRCVSSEPSGIDDVNRTDHAEVKTTNILVVIARPQMDRDIPHRFVSSSIVKVADLTKGSARVEIVRPGTFAAFEAHLGSKPNGFFHIVHFDMHGEATPTMYEHLPNYLQYSHTLTSSSSNLIFLQKTHKGGKLTFAADPRNAGDVADVLVKNGVKYAVLNACRSAAATGAADSNIATTLLSRGLVTVAAMSYKIASSAVDQMVRAFYKAVLLDGLTLPAALRDARVAMHDHPAKQTRYGLAVEVLDYLVPRCFHRLGVESHALVNRAIRPARSTEELLAALQPPLQDVVGRESDILLLESALLMESNVGILWGEPGIGKTALMRSVSEWWSKTSLIQNEGLCYLDLGQEDEDEEEESAGIDMAYLKADIAEFALGSADRASDIVQYLNENRHLVVLDHFEAWNFPDGRTKRRQQKLLKGCLSEVFGGASLFVLVSRHPESWLDNLAPLTQAEKPTFSLRMTGLPTSRGMSLFSDLISQHGSPNSSLPLEQDTAKYLEGLVKLVDGNPLALKMLVYDFCQKTAGIKEYLPGLLEGANIELQADMAEMGGESRVIRQLKRYCNKCTQEVLDAALSIRLAPLFAERSGAAEEDPISPEFTPRIHPASLGMFWGVMPMEDIVSYMMFAGLGAMRDRSRIQRILFGVEQASLSSSRIEIATLMFFNTLNEPDGFDRVSALVGDAKMAERMSTKVDTLIRDLRDLDLLDSPAAVRSRNDPQKPYHRLSPILTLYLRGDRDFSAGRGALQEAFSCFQLQSCLSFPFSKFYWRDDWAETRKQIGLNFYNYYGALLAGLHRQAGNVLAEWSVLLLVSNVSKGVFADKTRYELLAVAFDETLERGIRLLEQPPVVDPVVAVMVCGQREPIPNVGTPQEVANLGLRCAVLLETILSATVFRTGQFDGRQSREGDLVPLLQPHLDAVLAHLAGIDSDYARRAVKTLEFGWQGLVADVDNPEPFWSMRERYLSWLAESNGDSVSQDPFLGRNIPHWLNSLTVSGATLLDVQGEVVRLRKRKLFDEARRVVRRALEEELMTGSNQVAIRIGLLKCLVDVDTDDEQWEDALANTSLIHELQGSLPGRQALSLERRIEREQKLALLYDRAGDAATAQHLVRSLLRRANALHATNPYLEAKVLLLLSELPIVRRLDADVAAIYLMARALLVLERQGDCGNSTPATNAERMPFKVGLFVKTMQLTNDTQPQWMLGPANSRPQSVAIFFLATIFGQMVFPTFGIRLLLDSSPSVQRLAETLGLSNPRSLQQYAAINMFVTLRSVLNSQADSAMWAFLSGDTLSDGSMEASVIEAAQDLLERLFRPPGWQPRYSKFEGVDFEKQSVFFDHFSSVGEAWLAGTSETRQDGSLDLPATPWTPATIWRTTGPQGVFPRIMAVPEGYTVSTDMILRLAGYIVNEGE